MANYTPMMEQYFKIKNEYKYCLVFFRLGDFYELFFEDALIASKELDITLTGRDCGQPERAPMCGVPYHSAAGYISKLVEKGYKVAICEQTEDPKLAKSIVARDVIRVITPGTVLDSNVLDSAKNNYIVSLYEDRAGFGLAVADVSTGEFSVTSFGKNNENRIVDEIARYNPSEIITNPDFEKTAEIETLFKLKITKYEAWTFAFNTAHKKLCAHFQTLSLSGFGIENDKQAVCAAGALLEYLFETQKNTLSHISTLKPYHREEFMMLDISSRRNLELTETLREKNKKGSLLWVMDKTKTAMGARLLRKWIEQPLVNANDIITRLDAVEEYKTNPILREEIKDALNKISDLERLMSKVIYATANGRDFIAFKNSFQYIPAIKTILGNCDAKLNCYFFNEIDPLYDVFELIQTAIADEPPFSVREGGIIKDGFNTELDKHREAKNKGSQWLMDLEMREREQTGIKSLKIKYNKIFGYYIEITNSYQHLAPERYFRRQTLANCERYTTEELKEIEDAILSADGKIVDLEYSLFVEIREKIALEVKRIQSTANIISAIDSLQSLGEIADKYNYVKPQINADGKIEITDGRHPVVEQMISSAFVPNDTLLDLQNNRLSIITGPNMAGKSTYMRQVALITLMAQAGSFVPAKSANISVCDRIFTRVGASDDLATGQSTFMVEMNEVANILRNATKSSLIILDEIGRGTSTFDGLSIAWSVLEYIADENSIGAKTLFATHYHELTELEGKVPGVVNYCITVKEQGDDIIFLRKIQRGGADNSYGIQVAKLAGVPSTVINRSKEILLALNAVDIAKKQRSQEKNIDGDSIVYYGDRKKNPDNGNAKIIIHELLNLNVDEMTPREALRKLFEFKETAEQDNE